MSYIAFDIGNVICDVDLDIFISKLIELKIVESHADGFRILIEIQQAQDVGLTTLENYLIDVLKVKKGLIPELIFSWESVVKPNETMLHLIKNLENRGAQIALLSNIGYEHTRLLRTTYGDFFNRYIQHFSCEVGARKPFKLFYQSFLFENPKFDNCIYIDDIVANVESANNAGFRGFLFKLEKHTEDDSIAKEFNQILSTAWLPNSI